MVQLTLQEIEQYRHSPAHYAVACRNYAALNRILAKLPRLPKAGEVVTEEQSVAAEAKADQVSSMIDRRDVAGRETPLHLAVRLGDAVAVEMLMAAGADWSLQNEQGWSALQEAVCAREDGIAMIITRYYQPMAWAKWCRRLPRITGAMRRMRDLYMEITFQFESSVIPFISRIAPSDTYRIWKRGSNLRADMTLAGFDGFKIQRSDQSFLFLGDGSEDGKVPAGSLLVLTHKDKEVTNALEGAGAQPSEAEIAHEVAVMSQTNMYRPGIDVTQAELVPQLTWRRQEKTEMVGPWKARIHDMHHVLISVKSRRVPGAMTDEQLLTSGNDIQAEYEDDYANILTEEEQQQLEKVLSMGDVGADGDDDNNKDNSSNAGDDSGHSGNGLSTPSKYDQNGSAELGGSARQPKKNWLQWGRRSGKHETDKKGSSYLRLLRNKDTESSEARFSTDESNGAGPSAESSRLSIADKFASEDGNAFGRTDKRRGSDATSRTLSDRLKYAAKQTTIGKKENESQADAVPTATKKEKTKDAKENSTKEKQQTSSSGNHLENEYKKGLRPVLWLTPDFPLKTDELMPLLDILANKVKAVRRLRELLTTKLPNGMFPVKVAIPIIPTIRVVVTFNKFEELASSEEFGTPLSSPTDFVDAKNKEHESSQSSNSWFSWIRSSQDDNEGSTSKLEDHLNDIDPFIIPPDYTWIDMKEKKRRLKAKKAKSKKGKKPTSSKSPDKTNDTEREE